jgi:NitT/TauT family transport system substrate-binding protein
VRRFTRTLGTAALVGALAVSSGCSGSEDDGSGGNEPPAIQKVSFLAGLNVQGRDSFVLVAQEKGFFKEVGLEVEVQPGRGGEGNLKLLQSGQVDFSTLDITDAIIAYGKGAFKDFTIVSAIQQRNVACLTALQGSGITSPRDLAGKKIAYIPGGVVRDLFDTYAKLAGVDGSKITWVNMPGQAIPASLAAGSIDAAVQFVLGTPAIERAAKGRKAVVFPYSDYLTDLYGTGVAVSKKTAQEKPDLVRKFNQAMLKGLAYTIEHPDEAGEIYAKTQKLQPAPVAAAEVRLLKPYVQVSGAPLGALDRERLARSIAILEAAGAVPAGVNIDEFISFDFLPKS